MVYTFIGLLLLGGQEYLPVSDVIDRLKIRTMKFDFLSSKIYQ